MCRVPTLVTVKVGTVGGVLSSGSATVTVLLPGDLFPAASTANAENEYVAPGFRGGWGYFHVTLLCVPGTLISRPQLSRTRYEALPVTGSHANKTLHDVLPVDRRFSALAGAEGFPFANDGDSGDAVDTGSVTSWHALAATKIDPARTPKRESRSADIDASVRFLMGHLRLDTSAVRLPSTTILR